MGVLSFILNEARNEPTTLLILLTKKLTMDNCSPFANIIRLINLDNKKIRDNFFCKFIIFADLQLSVENKNTFLVADVSFP